MYVQHGLNLIKLWFDCKPSCETSGDEAFLAILCRPCSSPDDYDETDREPGYPLLLLLLFIHYATEAAHITLQTYKLKHKALKTAKTLHNRETKFRYQQSSSSSICAFCAFIISSTNPMGECLTGGKMGV